MSRNTLLTVRVLLPWDTTPEAVAKFLSNDVQQRIENLPGVEAAGQISAPPVTDFHVRGSFNADWLPQVANQPAVSAEIRNIVAGNLLVAIGTPLLAGRDFSAADQISTVPPFLVNEALVRGVSAEGRSNRTSSAPGWTGARDCGSGCRCARGIRGTIAAEPGPVVYWPANAAHGGWHRYFLVRTKVPPEQLAQKSRSREQVYQSDPQQSVGEIGTMDQLLGDAVAQPRAERSDSCVICRGRIAAGLHWNLWKSSLILLRSARRRLVSGWHWERHVLTSHRVFSCGGRWSRQR